MILIDTLAIEHGLINQMVNLMRKELESMAETNSVHVSSVGVLIDFMSTYATKCHCGKEDTILLKKLLSKQISAEHRKSLHVFKRDHVYAQNCIKSLQKARDSYLGGEKEAFTTIKECLEQLTAFYPSHMAREEELLTAFSIEYFTDEEREDMLEEFWDYDKKLIKEKYKLKKSQGKTIRKKTKAVSSRSNESLRAYC